MSENTTPETPSFKEKALTFLSEKKDVIVGVAIGGTAALATVALVNFSRATSDLEDVEADSYEEDFDEFEASPDEE